MLYVHSERGFVPAKDEHVLAEGVATAKRMFDARTVQLRGDEDVRKYVLPLLATKQYEVACVAYLDSDKKLIAFEELSQGSAIMCPFPPRRIVQRALELNATAVILVHNHPTGGCEPSDEDIDVTVRIKMLIEQLEIELCEHYVVSKAGVTAISRLYEKRMRETREKLTDSFLNRLLSTRKVPEPG